MADERSADEAEVRDDSEGTVTHNHVVTEMPRTSGRAGRFTPGTILAERYRIVAPLGSGGVGDVYRAEDMKLGQTVALKFVTPRISHERNLLERIVTEVRIGRQVSHPNLCRIYDMGEVDDQHFITMEYVDGENLASLLRRVGRLPVHRGHLPLVRGATEARVVVGIVEHPEDPKLRAPAVEAWRGAVLLGPVFAERVTAGAVLVEELGAPNLGRAAEHDERAFRWHTAERDPTRRTRTLVQSDRARLAAYRLG